MGNTNTLKSIEEMYHESPSIDRSDIFNEFSSILEVLKDRLAQRFELTPDPCSADLQPLF